VRLFLIGVDLMACRRRDNVEEHMTAEQIDEAQKAGHAGESVAGGRYARF
jgi:hypothetical protein